MRFDDHTKKIDLFLLLDMRVLNLLDVRKLVIFLSSSIYLLSFKLPGIAFGLLSDYCYPQPSHSSL